MKNSTLGDFGLYDDGIVAPYNSESGAYSITLLSYGMGEVSSSGVSLRLGYQGQKLIA